MSDEGKTHPEYLPTLPGTYLEFSVKMRDRPCWRCRFRLRWPPGRRHFQCRPGPTLRYLEPEK
jgi:hypothetical protein